MPLLSGWCRGLRTSLRDVGIGVVEGVERLVRGDVDVHADTGRQVEDAELYSVEFGVPQKENGDVSAAPLGQFTGWGAGSVVRGGPRTSLADSHEPSNCHASASIPVQARKAAKAGRRVREASAALASSRLGDDLDHGLGEAAPGLPGQSRVAQFECRSG